MAIELWLMRHGETEWSVSGAHTSTTDIPLTTRGREMAATKLRAFLGGKQFAAVFTSPMQRAQETCQLAGFGDQMQVEPNLVEWNYGEAEGKSTPQMRELHGPAWSVWTSPLPGGETPDEVGTRADRVIARALAAASFHEGPSAAGEAVALFAHAHILRILAARWCEQPAAFGAHLGLSTGSVSVLGWERSTRVIRHWNRALEGE